MNESVNINGSIPDTPEVKNFHDLFEYEMSVYLWTYVPPLLIILGTIGNILTIVVLSRSSMRYSTTSLYLRVLAVVDIIVLNTGLLRQWLLYLIDVDIRVMTEIGCKIHVWMVYFSVHSSAWLLVSVTLERVLSVTFPHLVKVRCTRKTAYVIITTILVFFLLLNAHFLYGLGDVYEENGNETNFIGCDGLTSDYNYFERTMWPWIDLTFYSALPSTILVISNFCIIRSVFNSDNNVVVNSYHGATENRKRNTSSMTLTLLVVSATYVICTTPFCIFLIYSNIFVYTDDHSPNAMAVMDLIWALVNLLQYTNNAVNFILYCVTGSRFRQELIGLLCKKNMASRPATWASASQSTLQTSIR